jgi:hypothetical protein
MVESAPERGRVLNAVALQNAVLCAECGVVNDSPHDVCLVCGSRSLFNIARLFGGNLPEKACALDCPRIDRNYFARCRVDFPKTSQFTKEATGSRHLSVVTLNDDDAQLEHGMLAGPQGD